MASYLGVFTPLSRSEYCVITSLRKIYFLSYFFAPAVTLTYVLEFLMMFHKSCRVSPLILIVLLFIHCWDKFTWAVFELADSFLYLKVAVEALCEILKFSHCIH